MFHQKFFIVASRPSDTVCFIDTGLYMFAGGPLFCSVIKFKVWTGTVPKRFGVLIVVVHVVSLSRCEFKVGDFKGNGSLADVLKSVAGRYLKGPSRRVFAVIARSIMRAKTSIGHLKRDGVAFIVQLSIYRKKSGLGCRWKNRCLPKKGCTTL